MAILGSNYDMMQTPQNFGQYIPQPMDFRTTPEYEAAMAAYNQAYAQTPAGMPAGQAPGYDEASGMHYAGSQRMADQTAGDYQANLLNSRMMQAAAQGPGSPDYKQFLLAMNSRAGVRPDEMGLAYNAMNPQGGQVLNPALAALLERLGIGPAPVPGYEGGPNGLPIQSLGPKTPAPTTGENPGQTPHVPTQDWMNQQGQQGSTTEIDNRRQRPTPGSGSTPSRGGLPPEQGGFGGSGDFNSDYLRREAERMNGGQPLGPLGGGNVGVPDEVFQAFMEHMRQQLGQRNVQQPPMSGSQPSPAAYGYTR